MNSEAVLGIAPHHVEVQVGAVHVEPHLRVGLDALQGVHRPGGLVEERSGTVHVVVLLVLPGPRRGVTVNRPGMLVGIHLVAVLEYVLDDPEPLGGLDLEHLELAAIADVDEGKVIVNVLDQECRQKYADIAHEMWTDYAKQDEASSKAITMIKEWRGIK